MIGVHTIDLNQIFGSRAVVQIDRLQDLLHVICKSGYEHHAAMTGAFCADVLAEAFETYLVWEVYFHK